jgi:hypothetical protein
VLSGGVLRTAPVPDAMLAMVVLLPAAAATRWRPRRCWAVRARRAARRPEVLIDRQPAQARLLDAIRGRVAALVVALIVFAERRIVWPLIAAVALSYLMRQNIHLLWTRWAAELTASMAGHRDPADRRSAAPARHRRWPPCCRRCS